MKIADAHILVVAPDDPRYPFDPAAAPAAAGELDDRLDVSGLLEALADGTLSAAVLVQRNRFYGDDNALICDVAAQSPNLRALCSVDGRRADCAALAEHWLARGGAGLRFMEPHKGASLEWIASEAARDTWAVAAAEGKVVDVHAFPWNRAAVLPVVADLLRAYPSVPILLDNLGNGPIEEGAPDFGIDPALRQILDHPRLILKFSDMTLARAERAGVDAPALLARFAEVAGAERIAWGSDVLPPGRPLAEAAGRAIAATGPLGTARQRALLYETTARLFGF